MFMPNTSLVLAGRVVDLDAGVLREANGAPIALRPQAWGLLALPARQVGKVVTKAIKNVKWVAGKFASKRVVLHSFAHLGRDTAPSPVAGKLVEAMAERLRGAGYEVTITQSDGRKVGQLHFKRSAAVARVESEAQSAG